MSTDEIFERVRDILVDQLSLDPGLVLLESDIKEDLGADSLDTVDLIMSIEDGFEIEIPDEITENIKSVGDIVNYIESKQ
ncbi:MAG: acyl carrier protein [Oscillospiraceae bacterium]|jgi:acyl carrier protein|nr:acyl carrier protein [Oscillospiraceae bacterium]